MTGDFGCPDQVEYGNLFRKISFSVFERRIFSSCATFFCIVFVSCCSATASTCPTTEDLSVSVKNPAAELTDCHEIKTFKLQFLENSVEVGFFGSTHIGNEVLDVAQRSLVASASTLKSLGAYQTAPIKLYFASEDAQERGVHPPGNIATAIVSAQAPSACIIIVWQPLVSEKLSEFSIAHEFFHCLQFREFASQILAFEAGETDPAWWLEGTAEWFAAETFPGTGFSDEFIDAFHWSFAGTEEDIFGFSYENIVFFKWISGHHGRSNVVEFIGRLPTRNVLSNKDAFALAIFSGDFENFLRDIGGGAVK